MLKKTLLYLLGTLVFILWAGQSGQSQSKPEIPLKQRTCGDLWPVYKDKKWGYIDKTGRIIIPFKFDSAGIFSEGLVSVEQNDKVGFIDKAGRQVIPPRYDNAQPFSEGLASVMIKSQYGYIDRSGKMVIPPQFEDAGPFSEGLALISFNGKQWNYINKSGKIVINGEAFVMARGFSEGMAAAMGENEKYGFIDKTGKFVIQPQFHRVGDFSEGLAAVQPGDANWPGDLA